MNTELITAGETATFAEPKSNVDWNDNYCNECGRKAGKNPFYIEVVNGGEIRLQDGTEADVNDAGYMGFWPIGSECAKKYDPRVLTKLNVKAAQK